MCHMTSHRLGLSVSCVAAVVYPVVDNVVSHIHPFVCLSAGTGAETWRTRDVVSYQVMMVRVTFFWQTQRKVPSCVPKCFSFYCHSF